jgi:hypothetical protein
MTFPYPCARCQCTRDWVGDPAVVGGVARCTGCDIIGTNSMSNCSGCNKFGFLYPTRCATCSNLPSQVFLILRGMTLTLANGTTVKGSETGAGIVMVIGNTIHIGGSFGDINICGGMSVTLGIPKDTSKT